MSLLSWPVLLGGLLVSSPALWAAYVDGTLSPTTALIRLGICVGGMWIVLSVAQSLVEDADAAARRAAKGAGSEPERERPADVDLG